MAMNAAQQSAFKAGSTLDPGKLELICLGLLMGILFLWFAWATLTVFRGWRAKQVTESSFIQFFISSAILLTFAIWFFAS